MKTNLFVDEFNGRIEESFYVSSFEGAMYYGDSIEEIIKKILEDNKTEPPTEGAIDIPSEEFELKVRNTINNDTVDKIELVFQQPDYKTVTFILQQVITSTMGGDDEQKVNFDLVEYTRLKLYFTLKEWNIEKNGVKAPVDSDTLLSLHPDVVQGIVAKMNKHIKDYRV